LELIPKKGIQYARSSGSHAKILNINTSHHATLVKLPSGVKKYFSIYSIALPAASALQLKEKLSNCKSGFWRILGKKSKVRGVAKNPIDHPHGGRTKAIKYPRTP
jgi:large subunit ribosomal protein L2